MPQSKCAHCQLKFNESAMISDAQGRKFCCTGCQSVFEILYEQGLGEFYERLGKSTLAPVNLSAQSSQNLENIYQNYVKKDGALAQVNLIIEGIHCSACVWLIEKALVTLPGVLEVNLNAINHKMLIVWEEGENLTQSDEMAEENLAKNDLLSRKFRDAANKNSKVKASGHSGKFNDVAISAKNGQSSDVKAGEILTKSGDAESKFINTAKTNTLQNSIVGEEKFIEISDSQTAKNAKNYNKQDKSAKKITQNFTNLGQILARIEAVGYHASPYDAGREEARMSAKRRDFYARLLVGVFCSMNIMWMAIAQWAGYFTGIDGGVKAILSFAQFVLATPVLFYTGGVFFAGARAAIKARSANMDLLVISGASAAYIYSIYAMFARSGEVYFDSVSMIITFVFVGKFLEILSKKSASDTIDALTLSTLKKVCVIEGESSVFKDATSVQKGELISLKTGEQALIDGVVVSGEASIDMANISGESVPVALAKGDEVKSGSVCVSGSVLYEASEGFEASFLARLIALLEAAPLKKPDIARLADMIAPKFSLVVIALAAVSFVFWLLNFGFERALIVAISVVIIACPCALALATPVATLVALGLGVRNGAIFKEARIIETLAKCDTVVFDKTGTLTDGKLAVRKFENFGAASLDAIYSLASASAHPVSAAVASFLSERKARLIWLENVREFAARGVMAELSGMQLVGGNAKFLLENGVDLGLNLSETTEYLVAQDGKLIARFELEGQLREEAGACVGALRELGLEIWLLSGDGKGAVKSTADALGIVNFRANYLPEQKTMLVQNLQSQGKKVLMVGDGINDAGALSAASVAACMGRGADVSLARSDVVLPAGLTGLARAVIIARATLRVVRQNLVFSLGYNALTLPLAMMGYVIPLVAAASMSFSSLVVVLNSLRIKRKFRR